MKVAIVDDHYMAVNAMMEIANAAGHKTLGINYDSHREGDKVDSRKILHTGDIDEIVEAIKQFNPDVVFLDHFLTRTITGYEIACKLEIDKKRLVCTSTSFQSYCGRHFDCFKEGGYFNNRDQVVMLRLINESL